MSLAIRYFEFGDPSVLQLVEVDEPTAGEGQVRVAVAAAGLNPYDYKARRGEAGDRTFPSGQGAEFAGVVDQVGEGVTDVQLGDEVLGWTFFAAQAEYVVVAANRVAPKPPTLTWEAASSIGLVGNTARRSVDALNLRPDDTVLVSAASGGVGIIACQLAVRAGATVVGTASATHHAFLRSIGVIPVAYGEGEEDRLRAAAPQGFTAMADNQGRHSVELGLSLGIQPDRINSIVDYDAAETFGISTVGGGGKTAAELTQLATELADGSLRLPIRASYPMDQVQDAYRELETGHGLGKVVLTIP